MYYDAHGLGIPGRVRNFIIDGDEAHVTSAEHHEDKDRSEPAEWEQHGNATIHGITSCAMRPAVVDADMSRLTPMAWMQGRVTRHGSSQAFTDKGPSGPSLNI